MFVFRLQYILIFIDWSESDILLNISTNTAQAVFPPMMSQYLAPQFLNMTFPLITGN